VEARLTAPTLSIVMPAYNEEGSIALAVSDVQTHVFSLVGDAELIVVDDGSRDGTGRILDDLATKGPRLRVVHQANGGHGKALRTGLDIAAGKYVFLIDSDRQIPLEAFAALWEQAQKHDAAFGVRTSRNDGRIRLILTRIIRYSVCILFGTYLRDANVPFKVVRRQIWLSARPWIPAGTLAPSLFLALYVRRRRFSLAQVPVSHRDRQTGVVSIRRWKLFKFCAKALAQLLAFRWRLTGCPRSPTSLSSAPVPPVWARPGDSMSSATVPGN
jgi:glycosyltransferase involved in cell wall biosynthesis